MIVKVTNYGKFNDENYVEYSVCELTGEQMNFLDENLAEETNIEEGILNLKMYFDDDLYPFQSDAAQFRLDDFIAREEIEMALFLSSFLEDM